MLHAPSTRSRLSSLLTSKRGAWVALGVAVVVFALLYGVFGRATAPSGNEPAARDAESSRAAGLLAGFPDADEQSVLLVVSRPDGDRLTADQIAQTGELVPVVQEIAGHPASGPMTSADGAAAVIIVPITLGADNAETAEVVKGLRAGVAPHVPSGLQAQVTGGPAFGADVAGAFQGADLTLLLVTILIVAILLILTYRSPILWLLPLTVVALADQLATKIASAVGSALDLPFDTGIISVLVFGAGTNYALLLISRYREELFVHDDHRTALRAAWKGTAPAILASNATVVLALLTLLLAVIPGTRGLGVAAAAGLIVALVAVLFVLPPLLAVCGRRVFWPRVPRPGAARSGRGVWPTVAARVMARPGTALVSGVLVLLVMAGGIIGTGVGLDQVEKFRVHSESAAGLEVLAAHFPPGEAQPMLVVTRTDGADRVRDAIAQVDGVVRVVETGRTADGDLTRIVVTGEFAPSTPESLALVAEVRSAAHAVAGADALVGGAVAADLDARSGNERDLLVIAPLVLLVSFVVLVVLLRSLLAPVLLLVVNALSALAAIGAGSWLSRVVFGQSALDLQVPLLAFLFLVALGIDYTIFLVHRARAEAATHGTRAGMVRAVGRTGAVITSAGVVLAAVFAALGVLPLVTLGQLGLIVGVGVIADTLIVRTVVVPSLFGVRGERIWWPRRPAPTTRDETGMAKPATVSAGAPTEG